MRKGLPVYLAGLLHGELPGGILASVSIAEFILESGYGKSELALGG